MDVLDLAPSYRRRQSSATATTTSNNTLFHGLTIDEQRVSYAEVTNVQAQRGRRDPEAALQTMLETLMQAPREDHQRLALEMINQIHEGVHPSNERSLLILGMIASGNIPLFRESEDEDEDEEDDDDDDEEEVDDDNNEEEEEDG